MNQSMKTQEPMNYNTKFAQSVVSALCYGALMILLSVVSSADLSAQCSRRAMACNNLLHLALDDSCQVVVTPDMILEDMVGVPSDYELRIFDPQGQRIMGNVLREDYDCQKLQVEVECKQSDIYCWGYIIVEDKIKPDLTISPLDTAVCCNVYDFNLQPNSLVTEVTFSDQGSCEKPDSLGIIDLKFYPKDNCSDTLQVIERYWRVVDKSKYRNDSTVIQRIHILRPGFDKFEYPRDTIIDCADVGDLSPAKLGEPELRSCKDFFDITMREIEFPGVCGAARKISRSWRIFDTCRNRDTTVYQTIEIIDTSAPVIDFGVFRIPSDRFEASKEFCTASARDIPNPIITDCSIVEADQLRAFYQFVDDANQPFGFRYPAVINDIETFDLVDVPIGQPFLVIFEATDSCGNISQGSRGPFTAEDTSDPNAVCEKTTIVSINNTGLTEVTAQAVDDYSYDNCGVVRKEIRRLDSHCSGYASDRNLGNSVHFCCEDVANNPIRVLLRVYDAYDNYSDCIIDVIVQDKRVPTIVCEDDIELDCSFDLTELDSRLLQSSNVPDVTWICGEGTIVPTYPDVELSQCGYASFLVTWTATDANGSSAICQQRVTIDNRTPISITPPTGEITLNDCNGGIDPADIGGAPTVTGVDCEQIIISHEDTPFEVLSDPNDPDLCRKITRTWSILDWCKFDGGNANSAIVATYTQVIKIRDNANPAFTSDLEDFEVLDTDKDCKQAVSITVNATDNCTDTDDLVFTYEVDVDGDGTADITGNGNTFENELPVGTYEVTFTVEDECGNLDQTTASFEVVPSKAPTPILFGVYPANIQPNGQVTILASDVNQKSTQGCSSREDGLIFAFSSDPNDITKTFTCSDVPDGVKASVPTEIFVIDQYGNFNSSVITIELSDLNHDACADNVQQSIAVSGTVMSEDQSGVSDIAVTAYNAVTNKYTSTVTDKSGRYTLDGLTTYDDYRIIPALDGYDDTGLSTIDILLIQRHILGLTPLDSPYKIIAADVNGSQSLTAADLVALRRLLLGRVSELDEPWRFVSGDHPVDMDDPWSYPAAVELLDLNADVEALDFIGVKTGDVSGDAFGALAGALAGTRSIADLSYSTEQNGDLITYTLTPDGVGEIAGLQMALRYGDMILESVDGVSISLDPSMIAVVDGQVRISWSGREAVSDDEPLMRLTFRGASAEELTLDPVMSAEMYSDALETSMISLSREVAIVETGLQLLSNMPNPFSTETLIQFVMPKAGEAELAISDMSGQVIYTHRAQYDSGLQTRRVLADDLPAAGVYYYTITTEYDIATRRMIVIR